MRDRKIGGSEGPDHCKICRHTGPTAQCGNPFSHTSGDERGRRDRKGRHDVRWGQQEERGESESEGAGGGRNQGR